MLPRRYQSSCASGYPRDSYPHAVRLIREYARCIPSWLAKYEGLAMLVCASEDTHVFQYSIRIAVNNTMFIGMDQCFSSMDSLAFFPSDATCDTTVFSL
jgi:hypothetical protein